MFKLFEIKEGKFKVLPTLSPKYVKGFLIISITTMVIASLSGWLRLDEKQLWKIYNAIIQRFGLTIEIPKSDNEKEIDAKIELEVDKAIDEYKRLTGDDGVFRVSPPRYSEKPVDNSVCYTDECKSLGGEMRLCAPWVDNCKKE